MSSRHAARDAEPFCEDLIDSPCVVRAAFFVDTDPEEARRPFTARRSRRHAAGVREQHVDLVVGQTLDQVDELVTVAVM
jgi:hypothetical protein